MSRLTVLAAFLLWSLAWGLAGWITGRDQARDECEAGKVRASRSAIEDHNRAAAAGAAVETRTVARLARGDDHFRGLILEAYRHAKTTPYPADCRLSSDGLRLWRAANAGAGTHAAGEPDDAAPGEPAAAGERPHPGLAGEPHRGGEAVSPDAGAAARPGGVAGADQ